MTAYVTAYGTAYVTAYVTVPIYKLDTHGLEVFSTV